MKATTGSVNIAIAKASACSWTKTVLQHGTTVENMHVM